MWFRPVFLSPSYIFGVSSLRLSFGIYIHSHNWHPLKSLSRQCCKALRHYLFPRNTNIDCRCVKTTGWGGLREWREWTGGGWTSWERRWHTEVFDAKISEESHEVGRTCRTNERGSITKGNRKRGRPRIRWRDCIERDMRTAELEDVDWRMVDQDRGQWRSVVHRAAETCSHPYPWHQGNKEEWDPLNPNSMFSLFRRPLSYGWDTSPCSYCACPHLNPRSNHPCQHSELCCVIKKNIVPPFSVHILLPHFTTNLYYNSSLYICLSQLANCRSHFLLDRLGRCLKLFVLTDGPSSHGPSSHAFASQFGLAIFYTRKTPKTITKTESSASFCWMNQRATRRKGAVTPATIDRSPKRQHNERRQLATYWAKTAKSNTSKRWQRAFIPSRLDTCGLGIIT